jgi:cysteine desulfurase NifS/selenium donor protein
MKTIYLDYNATTPVDPAVAEAMLPILYNIFGNPSSSHPYGVEAKQAVESARKAVAGMLNCQAEEVIFTSGGSESNNYAIKGMAYGQRSRGNHLITSRIEHPAVTEVCRYLEEEGFRVSYLPVDKHGLVNPADVEAAITPQTILITIMHANNETGTIQPIREISEIARSHRIAMHTDAAQSPGKIPVDVDELGVDLLSIAGHKLYAPKGIGALYIRSGVQLEKMIHGAEHELNKRAGTENVLEIVGLGKACELISGNLPDYQDHMKRLRDRLQKKLLSAFPQAKVNGHPDLRLPNTLSISFPGLEANTILSELTSVAASAGAACHSDQIDVSHVLEAMGVPTELAMGTIRFSVGRGTTAAEIDRTVEDMNAVVEHLQPRGPMIKLGIDMPDIKLTRFTHGLGCACKLRPQLLEEVLKKMPKISANNLLVGPESSDDAAIYQLSEDTAIVQTVDFFTPIVDDPYQFGAIAMANSLSDIYAMGGKPLFALNIVAFPSNRLPMSVLEAILMGAQEKASEAGIIIAGGHTVDDNEPKYGLAVTGVIHPTKILKNNTAQVGDVLILTKPLGTGILSTALKKGVLNPQSTERLVSTMAALNKSAAEVMQNFRVNAVTDITGFGLTGHLLEMMKGSQTSAILYFNQIPFLPGVTDLLTTNVVPGGTRDNYAYTLLYIDYPSNLSEGKRLLLNDAQTSGGLLISLPQKSSKKFLENLKDKGVEEARIIGEVRKMGEKYILVE